MKNYVKIGTGIILAMLSVLFAGYALLKGDISFKEFRSITTEESQNIDKDMNELFE